MRVLVFQCENVFDDVEKWDWCVRFEEVDFADFSPILSYVMPIRRGCHYCFCSDCEFHDFDNIRAFLYTNEEERKLFMKRVGINPDNYEKAKPMLAILDKCCMERIEFVPESIKRLELAREKKREEKRLEEERMLKIQKEQEILDKIAEDTRIAEEKKLEEGEFGRWLSMIRRGVDVNVAPENYREKIKKANDLLSEFDKEYHEELCEYIKELGVEAVKNVLEFHSIYGDTDSQKMQLISSNLGLFLKKGEQQ